MSQGTKNYTLSISYDTGVLEGIEVDIPETDNAWKAFLKKWEDKIKEMSVNLGQANEPWIKVDSLEEQ